MKPTQSASDHSPQQRKKSIAARLLDHQLFLDTLLNAVPIPIFFKGKDGRYLGFNKAFEKLFGRTRDELIGKNVFEVNPKELAAVYFDKDQELFTHSGIQIYESQVCDTQGCDHSVIFHKAAFEGQDGEVKGLIGAILDITDFKQRQNELRESEERYRLLAETMAQGVMHLDAEGVITAMNSAAERILGRNREQFICRRLADLELSAVLTNQEPLPIMQHPAMVALQTGQPVSGTILGVFNPELGHYRWIRMDATPVFHLDKTRPSHIYTIFEDITESRQIEQDRELHQKRLELLLELSTLSEAGQDEILAFSLEAIQTTVQSEFALIGFIDDTETEMTITAWSQEVMSNCALNTSPQKFSIAAAGLWGESIRQRVPTVINEYAAPNPHKRGYPPGHLPIKRFLEIPVFDGDRIVAIAAAANKTEAYTQSDINALTVLMEKVFNLLKRKSMEEALRANREEIKAYLDNSFDVIFALDQQGNFLFVSRAWERHFGYPIGEVLGKNFAHFVHPDDVAPCAHYLADILNGTKDKMSPPYRVQDSDGSWRWFIANGSRYRDGRTDWRFIGVGHDITEQLQSEDRLRQAKVAAEAASQAKSAFLATMSHEIRTPLSALLGKIELLEASQLAPPQLQHLNDCRIASEMLLQVLNDVLDFSKIEAGKLELNNEIFSVCSTAWQLIRIFAGSAQQKGITLVPSLADDLPAYISGDQYRLRQIISNLLSNAIKFTDQGTVTLEISQREPHSGVAPNTTVLAISVRDTGNGIPLEKQHSIFESFTQLETLTTRHHTGTGLGLAICKRLAEMMGGTISVESVPGKGAAFTLLLPATVCQAPPQKLRPKRAGVAIPRTILLADDEALGRATTLELLRRRGHKVTAVANGTDLLNTLQQQRFDILLSDISMPDMDGMDVVRIIRSGQRTGIDTLIPAIAMTAHAFHKDIECFLDAGFNGYASKPINFEALLLQIDELCRKQPATSTPHRSPDGRSTRQSNSDLL